MSLAPTMSRAGDPHALAQRLRHRVQLQAPNETSDEAGGSSISWENVATLWAEITPLQAGRYERVFAEQLGERLTHRITLRYRADINSTQRILFGERLFNIRSVVNVGEAGVIAEILAEEGVAL